jgi:hypothetical protein
MAVEVTGSFESIDETQLAEFEATLQVRLPLDYREFLLKHNGGRPKPCCFHVLLGNFLNGDCITRFLGLHTSHQDSFQHFLTLYHGRVPPNLLPITDLIQNDMLCLSVAGDDYGKIYCWDHNWESEGAPDYTNVHPLVDNFAVLLDQLFDDGC